jgi:hypothetical protein
VRDRLKLPDFARRSAGGRPEGRPSRWARGLRTRLRRKQAEPTQPDADAGEAGGDGPGPPPGPTSAVTGAPPRQPEERPEERPEPSRLGRRERIAGAVAALALAGAVGVAGGWLIAGGGEDGGGQSPAPTVVVEAEPEPQAAEEIGFPAFATLNTTRVGGPDPTANAAGVALASYPSVGGVGGPAAVVMAPADDWRAAIAAASLTADPIGAPVLLGSPDEVPDFTAEALSGLAPQGIEGGKSKAGGAQVIAVGDVTVPGGLKTLEVDAQAPAELAAAIDRARPRLGGAKNPQHVLVVPSQDAAMAMPAAAWAARSGDPIVFADGDEVPKATTEVLERHPDAAVYVLGPGSSIGGGAIRELERTAGRVIRVEGPDPVTNSIAFARFVDGSFGWNVNDPGHGFTIANSDQPVDAAAAAPLSARGKPGPLLVTDRADEPPVPLRDFLLDTKPGYSDDPSRALYNHVWLLGDTSEISLAFQAQVDKLVELERVGPGRGVPDFGPEPGTPEPEAQPKKAKSR